MQMKKRIDLTDASHNKLYSIENKESLKVRIEIIILLQAEYPSYQLVKGATETHLYTHTKRHSKIFVHKCIWIQVYIYIYIYI